MVSRLPGPVTSSIACLLLPVVLALAACHRQPPPRQYALTGQVLAVSPDGREITLHHDEIPGFMPSMTMPFQLKDRSLARGRLPGDLVKATLLVTDDESWLSEMQKTGWAPLPEGPATAASHAVEVLKAGDIVPEVTLVDQDGRTFPLSSLRGSAVLLTFVYTRCPLPDFCPRMDLHFQAVQRAVRDGRVRSPVRLLSVSFDPDHDTPAVLRSHAARVGADARLWLYATGARSEVEAFGSRLGLSVMRDPQNPADITHNLRTAVIDARGRLVSILEGNRWTPEQAVSALASMPAS